MSRDRSKPGKTMKFKNIYPFALSILSFWAAVKLYFTFVFLLGFPDGFIAEREAAEEPLAIYLGWFFVAMGVVFLWLGVRSHRADVKRPVIYACVLIVLVAAACGALDLHYRNTMMDSRGG
jgi:H+/Cl- antiporter ClcA